MIKETINKFCEFVGLKPKSVKIKLLEGGIMPTKAHNDDAAWDCYAREDMLFDDKAKLIPLGFCMELPKGYHAEIVPRSSMGVRSPLMMSNSQGIIDANYRGELKACYKLVDYEIWAEHICWQPCTPRPEEFSIHKGERICQMLIVKDPEVKLVQVDELSDSERGMGGFGSTGV